MPRVLSFYLTLVFLGLVMIGLHACKHDPFEPLPDDDMMPGDTTVIDTMPVDTTVYCDPDVVYFDRDVLPILRSNCAVSGCHDAITAEEGIILESFETVTQTTEVKPFDLDESDIIDVITESREDKRMPPPPRDKLSSEQIQLISKWILQGAQDLDCQPDTTTCNTVDVSYSQQVSPVITNFCKGCHSGSAPSGGISLTTHAEVQTVALNGRLYGAIAWLNGFQKMPQGGSQLPDCTIEQFKSWIDAGAPNN